MHQSPQKNLPRRRDRQAELDPIGSEGQRRSPRAEAAKGRKAQWIDEGPRAEREERRSGSR
jgi:hypothetical protein